MIQVLECVGGVGVVAIMLLDIFLAVVVPRRAPNIGRQLRVSGQAVAGLWRLWRQIGLRVTTVERREALLGTFGPAIVIVLLFLWVSGLMFGYGLVLDGLRSELRPEPENFGTSLYFAGVAMLTIGFGDFVAVGPWARLVSLVAAATGLGLFALVITLLFTLYGSFQRRERAVVVLEAGAGAPPSGVTLLETYALGGMLDDLPRVFAEWQSWAAEVLDTHLAYPVLAYFRSSHDNDSWVSSLGAVMDAATLVLTTIED
ncbi:MAG TPA: ion channel, partial [Chloroflexota bacterium]|nr:ion channel [Chloroflexota bacterium]